jgi:hypothetical protein
VTHLLSILVFVRHPRDRRLFVRYEDFVVDPGGVLRQILEVSGSSTKTLPDFRSLDTGVPLQGNRVSRSNKLSLKPSSDPVPRSSRATTVLQAPLLALLSRMRPVASASRD